MRLNLGCGHSRLEGFLNIDKESQCNPDLLMDLEKFPWDFEDDSVDQIVLSHVLEHLGESSETYLSIMKELYRVCKADARIEIKVPHPRHDDFLTDPTHVRAILPSQFYMYSKKHNEEWLQHGAANTPLANYLNVDFEVQDINWVIDDKWTSLLREGKITSREIAEKAEHQYNIVKEVEIKLRVIKETV